MKKLLWLGIGVSFLTLVLTLSSRYFVSGGLDQKLPGDDNQEEEQKEDDTSKGTDVEDNNEITPLTRYELILEFLAEDTFNFYQYPVTQTIEVEEGYYFFLDKSPEIKKHVAFIYFDRNVYVQYHMDHDQDFINSLPIYNIGIKAYNNSYYSLKELSKW